jgi:hypothetical protein
MTTEQHGPELVRDDDDLTRELRAIYAPPRDAAYWSVLEAGILAHLDAGEGTDEWWSVPDRWLRTGLIAAAIAVIAAGTLLMRTQTQVSHMAYDAVIEPASIEILEVAQRQKLTEQQATFRILTGHDD